MRGLSLWEPWASMMAHGRKRIETRSWKTSYRGPLAICASAKGVSDKDLFLLRSNVCFGNAMYDLDLRPGNMVGVCQLVDCLPTVSALCLPGVFDDYPRLKTETELSLGDFTAGRYGWVTEKMVLLPRPIPHKGRQGLFNIEQRVADQIMEQMSEVLV